MDISIRDVRYFLAVAHDRSLTVAARECNVTEAALSKAVARVEAAVGFPLFDRSKRGMTLTQSGAQFHAHALKMRREHDDAMSFAADLRSGAVGFLRVGASRRVYDGFLAPAIAQMAAAHPRLEMRIQLDTAAALLRRLEQGQIDIVLAPLVLGIPRDVETHRFGYDELSIVARGGHPFFAKRSRNMAHLLDYGWIIPPRETTASKWLFEQFSNAGLAAPKVYVEVDYVGMASSELTATSDLILLSMQSWRAPMLRPDLRRVDIPKLSVRRPLYAVTRKDCYWTLSMQVLVSTLGSS